MHEQSSGGQSLDQLKLDGERSIDIGGRRVGGGRRVKTENLSNAACPARPRRLAPMAAATASWCSWSTARSATATLAATRRSGGGAGSAPVGIAKHADELVIDLCPRARNDQPLTLLHQAFARHRLDPDAGSVDSQLDDAGAKPDPISENLGNDKSS